MYGPDDSLGGSRLGARAERVEYVILPTSRDAVLTADWAAIETAFDVVVENDHWVLYRRDPTVGLPAGGVDLEPVDTS